MSKILNLIICVDSNYGIGNNDKMAWHIRDELNIFKTKTYNNVVIVGRKTYKNLPPLPNRTVLCVTNNPKNPLSIENAIEHVYTIGKEIYIIGGKSIYEYVLKNYTNIKIHISILNKQYDCDCFFDSTYLDNFVIEKVEKYDDFVHYEMVKATDTNFDVIYRLLIKRVLKGHKRPNRTGIDTLSLFNQNIEFDVSENFPLLTLKKVFTKGIFEELKFFISGSSDTLVLEDKKINIWKGNTSDEFLKNRGLDYQTGEMGPGYGWQWRHAGHDYIKLKDIDKSKFGIDQLQDAIDLIKTDPYSRRIIVNSWNVKDLDKMALPPCHYSYQFYCEDDDSLSISVTMRSCDLFLGLPFNIASYALLLYIISDITNRKPKKVSFNICDAHIYINHVEGCNKMLNNFMYKPCTLSFKKKIENIDDFDVDDIVVTDYLSNKTIKAEMAV